MSRHAISLLIDSGLLTAAGKPVDLSRLPDDEVSTRIAQYRKGRVQTIDNELELFENSSRLNALFGSESTGISKIKILPSALLYDSIIIDDPLVSASSSIEYESIKKGLWLFCEYFQLIKSGFITIIPLSLFNRPSNDVPLLMSDDAFRSSIPDELHDFIHSRAHLRSVVRDQNGRMLVLDEDASEKRRPALKVGFFGDYWKKGVQLYLFQTVEKIGEADGKLEFRQVWEPDSLLDEDTFVVVN